MDQQEIVLNQYMALYHQPSFRKISDHTGIQVTRVFRLFNGSTLKFDEYQIFHQKINQKLGDREKLNRFVQECSTGLSGELVGEIETYLKRKIKIWELKNNFLK